MIRRAFGVLLVLLAVLPVSTSERLGPVVPADGQAQTLTFEERVAAQRAIEEVYWRHRIWPAENSQPKPSLEAVLPESAIRAKVEEYLKKSRALEAWWQRPIRGEQLQAEMKRMARDTRQAEMLRELFSALNDDPFLIAECLARPVLADRLIHKWYARDDRYHGELRRQVEEAVALHEATEDLREMGGQYSERTWKLASQSMDLEAHWEYGDETVVVGAGEWEELLQKLQDPSPEGLYRLRGPEESDDSFLVTTMLSRGDDSLRTATVSWRKVPFDTWWDEVQSAIPTAVLVPQSSYWLTAISEAGCPDTGWSPTRQEALDPEALPIAVWTGTEMIVLGFFGGRRYDPATDSWGPVKRSAQWTGSVVWTGTEMIVWGGGTNAGARYNPVSDQWVPTSTGADVPAPRSIHVAVWTGAEMIVWGGVVDGNPANTGGRYDPNSDTWKPTSQETNVPTARARATAVWTGTEMIVWGGEHHSTFLNTGGRYNPSADMWLPTSPSGTSARTGHAAVWTGTEMIVWGGFSAGPIYWNTGSRYNPATDTWAATSTSNAPSGRSEGRVVWTGREMVVWGGGSINATSVTNTGGRYDPATDSWATTSTEANCPAARLGHAAVWTGTEMVVWGGRGLINGSSTSLNTGGRYDPASDSWVPTSLGTSPSRRGMHTAVWTGSEMIVWGGQNEEGNLATGGRYDPATDTWISTDAGENVPAPRSRHTAVWTGKEMIVWGGRSLLDENTGGQYDPATDTWRSTDTGLSVPSPRIGHTAVWTGKEMIVWGGIGTRAFNDGGRYDPFASVWRVTSTGTNVSSARRAHTAVWTGTEMIVWGGFSSGVDQGARYDPTSDSWKPIAAANVPSQGHTAVWTGKEMIVWGAHPVFGGRYEPATNAWRLMSLGPTRPQFHTAVWTGDVMIVWGGAQFPTLLNTGGMYDPSSDSWVATSVEEGVPIGRIQATAVWTGKAMIVWGGNGFSPLSSGGQYCPASLKNQEDRFFLRNFSVFCREEWRRVMRHRRRTGGSPGV